MTEKLIAKFENPPISRRSCCAYPRRERSSSSDVSSLSGEGIARDGNTTSPLSRACRACRRPPRARATAGWKSLAEGGSLRAPDEAFVRRHPLALASVLKSGCEPGAPVVPGGDAEGRQTRRTRVCEMPDLCRPLRSGGHSSSPHYRGRRVSPRECRRAGRLKSPIPA